MIGSELGHYRIESKLGEGGMGVVYKAHDTHLDRSVAIKVLSADAMSDPERKRRFVQEARTASALNHPNILHIYDIDRANGIDFMAMEFVQGKTLDQLCAHQGLPLSEVLNYGRQIAGALARAHEAGIVHRDIKPANIMVTPEGLVKVLDFGLAKLNESVVETDDSAQTQTVVPNTEPGIIFGTIQYMSPEQAEGKRIDARSDIFSLGSVLYEIVTGRRPFVGDSKLATLAAVLSKDPVPVREIRPDLPREMDEIVSRCLRKAPGDRFQSMGEVKAAIEALQESLRTAAISAPLQRPARRERKWLWAAAAAVLVVALAAVLFVWRGGQGASHGKLLAVLPFRSAASDPDSQALARGLGELLGRDLCRLNQFQVAARTLPPGDVRDDATRGPAEARQKLGVDLALTGTVERNGALVRATLALVDTSSLREMKRFTAEVAAGDRSAIVKRLADSLDLRGSIAASDGSHNSEAQSEYLEAHGYLRQEDPDRAIGMFQQALAKDPAFGAAQAGLAEAFWAKSVLTQDKQWTEKARENCLGAIARNAGSTQVHLVLGRIYSEAGRTQDAVDEFRKALEIDPDSIPGHTNLGEAYEALGQLQDSEAAYRELVARWPTYLLPYSHVASFYVRQGRYQDAEPAFRKVIELAPENANGYQNLGALYLLLGRREDAAAMLKKSLAIKPSASGYTNLGTLYFFQGRYSDAVPLMEKAAEMAPNNYVCWGNLGDAYRWAPEYRDKAADAYRKAIKLAEQSMSAKDAVVLSTLASYYAKLPDPAKAQEMIAQARRLAPMNPKVLFKAALVYEIGGHRDQALSALDLALQSGYSLDEIRSEPALTELRKDPRYTRLVNRGSPGSGAKTAR